MPQIRGRRCGGRQPARSGDRCRPAPPCRTGRFGPCLAKRSPPDLTAWLLHLVETHGPVTADIGMIRAPGNSYEPTVIVLTTGCRSVRPRSFVSLTKTKRGRSPDLGRPGAAEHFGKAAPGSCRHALGQRIACKESTLCDFVIWPRHPRLAPGFDDEKDDMIPGKDIEMGVDGEQLRFAREHDSCFLA